MAADFNEKSLVLLYVYEATDTEIVIKSILW